MDRCALSRLPAIQGTFFTAVITFQAHDKGTKYTAIAIHKDEVGRKKHEDMGFYAGWSQCFDQLAAHIKKTMQRS